MTESNSPNSTKPISPFDSLLAQCRDLVCERLAEAMDAMLDKVEESLSTLIVETPDRDARAVYLEAKNKTLAQRETIAEQFRAHYLREFQVRSNRVKKIGQSFSDVDGSLLELNLVGEDDLNETLKLNDMATKLRQYCDEELVALDQRVGVLLGDANLEAEGNPFSPQAICDAFKHTCRTVDTNVKVRMILLKLFDDHVLDDIRPVYKAVNALLVQHSILPKIRYGVSRSKESIKAPPAATPAAAAPAKVPPAPEKSPGDGPDFFSVLQDLLASNVKATTQPGVTGGTGGGAPNVAAIPGISAAQAASGSGGAVGAPMVVLQGAQLMDFLTRMQHGDSKAAVEIGLPAAASTSAPDSLANVLRELKGTSFSNGMNQMDAMTLDIVAMLFDQLFDDPKIPIAVKGLIGRMQIPMLKVAIADKAFFSKKSHPARRLLDTLGEFSSRLPSEFNASNPLFRRLEAIIQHLMDNFQDNVEIFDVVRERLLILVDEEDHRVEVETRSTAIRLEQNERLAASKTMAEFEVRSRVESRDWPRPVRDMLVYEWVKPLLIVHVRRGEHSDAWRNALETMDLLLWSVEAKETPEERSELEMVLPELLKRLSAGLKIADVEDAVRERFFSDLKKIHAELLRPGTEGEVAAAPGVVEETGAATTDIASVEKVEPKPEESARSIPLAEDEVRDLPPMEFFQPKETVPSTPALSIEHPDIPATESPQAKEIVPPTPPFSIELPDIPATKSPPAKEIVSPTPAPPMELADLPPIQLPEPKETIPPVPAATTIELLELPPIHVPEPKETGRPAETSHPPAPPGTPAPERSQSVKQTPSTSAKAPAPPGVTVPEAKSPVAPTPPLSVQAPAPPRAPVPDSRTPVVPAPPISTHTPGAPRIPVPETKQTVRPTTSTQTPATPKIPVPATPKIPVPATKQPVRPTPPTSTKAPPPPGTPVPGAGPAVRPTPPTSTQASAPPRVPVLETKQTVRPTPTPSNQVPGRPGIPVPDRKQPAQPIPPAAGRVPAPAKVPVPGARPNARPTPPSASRVPAPGVAEETDANSLDFTKSITIRNPFGGGEVKVEELEPDEDRTSGTPSAKVDPKEAAFINNLKEGTWLEFREKDKEGAYRPAKLSYVSPLKSSFLFVDRLGETVKECSRGELARLFRLGSVVVMDEAPLFDRMMAGLIGKLR